jgi:predicted enzyme related to lactoylglutathione lyase
MTTATRFATGTFCWTELHSNDQAASRAFYTSLFGWSTTDTVNPHGGTYSAAEIQGQRVAGIQDLDPQSKANGVPSHWLCYMAVDDVDDATAKAEGLGAKALFGPFDVLDLGRAVVLQDPAGAHLAFWQAGKHPGAGLKDSEAGSFCWFDNYTTDLAKSKAFYTGMFPYQTVSHDIHGMELVIFTPDVPGGDSEFAMMNTMEDRPSAWQPFFSVVDADATLARAVELGAEVFCPVMDAGAGRFAHFKDPQGATFGIFEWAGK